MSERVKLLWHLAAKDWPPLRPWAVLSWIATAVAWLPAFAPPEVELGPLSDLLPPIAMLLPVLALARVLHLDPVPGTTQLWLTRPIPPAALLAAKLALFTLTVLLPCLVLDVVPIVFTGVALRWNDHALVWIGTAVVYLALYAGAALPAALTRNVAQLALLLAAGLLALVVLRHLSWQWWPPKRDWAGAGAGLEASRVLVVGLLTPALALAGAADLYRRRRVRLVGVLAAALALPLVAVSRLWPVDVTGWAVALGAPSGPSSGAVERGTHGPDWRRTRVLVDGGRVGISRPEHDGVAEPVRMSAGARVSGLPPGLSLVQVGYSVTATVEGQGVLLLKEDGWPARSPTGSVAGGMPPPEAVALGCPWSGDGSVEIARLEGVPEGEWPVMQDVHGTLRFAVVRPFVLARGPARPGERFALPRRLVTVGSLAPTNGVQGVVLEQRLVAAPIFERLWPTNPDVVLFDPGERRCRRSNQESMWAWSRRARYIRSRIELTYWRPTYDPPHRDNDRWTWPPAVPRELLERSELVFLSAENLGVLEVPFAVTEIWRPGADSASGRPSPKVGGSPASGRPSGDQRASRLPGSYRQAVASLAPSAKRASVYSSNSIFRSRTPVSSIRSRMMSKSFS
jgi:hypothetical protein